MGIAYPIQKFQDWFTQQWVILWGKKIIPEDVPWLMGPFGEIGSIADNFIEQLAKSEGLIVKRDSKSQGLIPSIEMLNLSEAELNALSKNVINFYQNTSNYKFGFTVKWNPFFKIFGILVNKVFSQRIKQLNIPTRNIKESEEVNSEIITLSDPVTNEVKHTIWFRTFESNGQVIFSGAYSICTMPSEKKCIKAVFPLPKGNATIIMAPSVGSNGELILNSNGKKFGDPGFYFLLNDCKGRFWSRKHRSFRDKLIVSSDKETVKVEHTQTLWHKRVVRFNYQIELKL